jgi:hypothetical protein
MRQYVLRFVGMHVPEGEIVGRPIFDISVYKEFVNHERAKQFALDFVARPWTIFTTVTELSDEPAGNIIVFTPNRDLTVAARNTVGTVTNSFAGAKEEPK